MSERSRRSAGADQGSAHPLPSSPCRPSAHSPQPSPSSRLPTQMRTSSRVPAPPLLPMSQPARTHSLAGSAGGGQVRGSVRVTLERLYRAGGCLDHACLSYLSASLPVGPAVSMQCSANGPMGKGSRLYRAGPPLAQFRTFRKAAGVFKKRMDVVIVFLLLLHFCSKFEAFLSVISGYFLPAVRRSTRGFFL